MGESKKLSPHVILEINLKNLRFNYSKIKKKVSKKTAVAATVKADGYGLGSHEVVKSLIKEKCNVFFVATLDEAILLRRKFKQIEIQVLNGFHSERVKFLLTRRSWPTFFFMFFIRCRLNQKGSMLSHIF